MQHLFKANNTNKRLQPYKRSFLHALLAFVLLVPMMGWGQTTGIYYIINNNTNAYVQDASTNWYLVPASNGGNPSVDTIDWTWHALSPLDPEYPLVTTYQTNKDLNSVWVVKKSGDDYYLIHILSGKYMTYNTGVGSNSNRRTFHMESTGTGDVLFKFTASGTPTYYSINPKNVTTGHKYLNPSRGNKNKYYADNGSPDGGYNVGGIIGLYNKDASGDEGSKWFLEAAPLLTAPTISDLDPSTNTVTVYEVNGLPAGYNIHYTTNGTDPTASSPTLSGGVYTVTEACTLKAVVERYGVVLTDVAEKDLEPVPPEAPTFTIDCDDNVSLSCGNTPDASIYYTMTTDGSEPADPTPTTSSTLYDNNPISIANGYRMKAIACKGSCSNIASFTYDNTFGAIATITSDDCSETNPRGNVMVVNGVDGPTYWYAVTSVNGNSTPDEAPDPAGGTYTQYTLGTEVMLDNLTAGNNGYCTVHCYAIFCETPKTITSTVHQLKTSGKPTLTPPSGSSPVVLISGGVYGDVAVCTADMGTPEDTSDDVTQSLPIAPSGTAQYTIDGVSGILTFAFKHSDWSNSCEAIYTIPAPPAAPTYSQSCDNKLSLSTSSPMAVIHYTTDGSEALITSPTYSEGCLYSITPGTRVRAKAFEGFLSSTALDYTYQPEHVAAPTFFVNGNEVTISSSTLGATVYFTFNTNGNENEDDPIVDPSIPDPTNVSPGNPDPNNPDPDATYLYSTEFVLPGITKFKAVAVKDGMESSCIASTTSREGYTITNVEQLNTIAGNESYRGKYWFIEDNFDASSYNGPVDFTGVLVGNYHTISGLTKPLFNQISGSGVVRDLNLKGVDISTTGNAGAIACTATDNSRIYNCGILPTTADGTSTSQVGGNANVGGLVGELNENARVINCFSYADITSGAYRGGIVGNNNVTTASKQDNVNTMVMNCMFYGNIAQGGSGTSIAPIYGGKKISNAGSTGLNNYNYFRFNKEYVQNQWITAYNCALGAQDRNLERFEFYRFILNSNYELASWYIKGTVTGAADRVGHWVLDKSVAPYPILKSGEGVYPSIINPDAAHAVPIDADHVHRNEGRKLGELGVNISGVGSNAPSGAAISTTTLTLNVTDKDEPNYNFNYKKVQLPYYNEVGTGNYTNNKVVTGWKITGFVGGTPGNFSTDTYDYPSFNFVDRACTNKDLYSVSHRVFNQGAYYEVPDGVTAITIEPYWANCVYLSDAKYDVTYSSTTAYQVSDMGDRPATFNGEQTVYNNIATAINNLTSGTTVYDAAVVLVGNYHHYFNDISINTSKTLTIMSADMDNDNEPDNTFFYQHTDRHSIAPMRFDFINIPGIGMAQKEDGRENDPQPGIFHATGWFEITNTVLIRFGQFEYAKYSENSIKPIILHGGIYEQYVSTNDGNATYQYTFVGGNAWFNEFNLGCHTRSGAGKTPKHPVSVAGGDYEKFYLSGINKPEQDQDAENAECYIDGGRFGELAGAGMQVIKGDVTWLINGADITSFFGGGINDAKPITGNVNTTISNSWVTEFFGGPKFGNMSNGKTVTTTATNCNFGDFFGAGYGGTALNRKGLVDQSNLNNYDSYWNSWVDTHYKRSWNATYSGISTDYLSEYLFYSGGHDAKKVGRLYVYYASLSLASAQSVTSTLTGCTIGNFYGGGKLGAVEHDVVSSLTDCTVTGNAFGSGYSAAVPTVEVTNRKNSQNVVGFEVKPYYNNAANVFNDEQVACPVSVTYTWKHTDATISAGNEFDETDGHFILTNQSTDQLGAVKGNAILTIKGNSVIGTEGDSSTGNVYGGGDECEVVGNTTVILGGNTNVRGNVYGGGNRGTVNGNSSVTIAEP